MNATLVNEPSRILSTPLTGRIPLEAHRWLIERPIAHRGLHGAGRPENSLSAFCAAADAGVPIELDVRLLSDGTIAVIHDATVQRLTGDPSAVAALDIVALRSLRILGSDETIPTLDAVLDAVQGRVPVLIEIKTESHRAGLLEHSLALRLQRYEGPVAVQSFSPVALGAMRRLAPQIVRGQLSGTFSDIPQMPSCLKAVLRDLRFMRLSQPDFIAYELTGLPSARVSRFRGQGMPLLAWTIRSPAEAQQAVLHADNYIFESCD